MHACLVLRYVTPDSTLADKTGSVEPLEDGNAFIYWGGTPLLSEHTSDGSRVVFEARWQIPLAFSTVRGRRTLPLHRQLAQALISNWGIPRGQQNGLSLETGLLR